MWSRVDDNIPHHPKFLRAGPVASWLWICGNCYCNRYLTDGFIPSSVVPTLSSVSRPLSSARVLVSCLLWERVKGGYKVHDFLDHNPTAKSVKLKREQDRVRKESERRPNGIQTDTLRIPSLPAPAIPSHPIPEKIPSRNNKLERDSSVSTTSGNGSNGNGHQPVNARSKHPIFQGQRFVVFDWMLEDLMRSLGEHTNAFDLHEWFFTLDSQAAKDNRVMSKTDWWPWIQGELISEAKRRNLPIGTVPRAGQRVELKSTVPDVEATKKYLAAHSKPTGDQA